MDTKVFTTEEEPHHKMQYVRAQNNQQNESANQDKKGNKLPQVTANYYISQYLLNMRRFSGGEQTDLQHSQQLSRDFPSNDFGDISEKSQPRSRFASWLPSVQATSPVSSAPAKIFETPPLKPTTSSSSTDQLTTTKNTSIRNQMDCTVSHGSANSSTPPAVGATNSTTNTTTTSANASAHRSPLLSPSASSALLFTSPVSASSTTAARVNLVSNALLLQNSFMFSRLNPQPPSQVTIKLINQSSLGTTQSQSETDGNTTSDKSSGLNSASSDSGESSVASPTRPRQSPDEFTHSRLRPHRHSLIYDSFDQPPPPFPRPTPPHPSTTTPFFHPSVASGSQASRHSEQQQPQQQQSHSSLIHHQFHHLTLAEKERFERLFREIDTNDNGYIDFNDLVGTLERKGIRATHDNVKHVIERSDTNLDGDIDFAEFVNYCLENEKKLHILFKDIDLNDDGKIDTDELVLAFERAGIEVDDQEVLKLVHHIKRNDKSIKGSKVPSGAIELDFEEFRDYLLLHPTDSLSNLMRSWRHGTFVDLGEDGLMPVDFSETEIRTGMWWRHLIAGGVAGAVSRTATAPLDRLKVFLQVRGAEFNGLSVCLRHMINEGGVISLWRGNGINVLKIAPETAIKFMAFDQMKRWIHSNKASGEISIVERFLAGSLAGAVSQTVIYPMEVLKTRFCLRSTGQYSGLLDAARKINSQGGLRNFYRGYVPNLIGIIPYAGIDLTVYETLKKMYLKHNSLEEAPIFVCLACGTLSSTFGQIASYPLALVRTRMQSETGYHSSSMVGMFRTIYQKEGPRGLYRGITANIMKVAPAVSISYVVYEYTRRPLGAIMS